MRLNLYLIFIVIYFIASISQNVNFINCLKLSDARKNDKSDTLEVNPSEQANKSKENDENENSENNNQNEKQSKDENIDSDVVSEREESSERSTYSGEDSISEKKLDNEELDIQKKNKINEEDEKNELKKLEEFKRSEIMEKNDELMTSIENNQPEADEKYRVESELLTKNDVLLPETKATGENEFTITKPTVNQIINNIIQPTTDEKELKIETKDFDPESDNDDNKKMKAVILSFDLSDNMIVNKISLITKSKLTITRYIGTTPQKVKVTIVDPTLNISHSQTRLSELSKFDSIEYNIKQKVAGKADTIVLGEIASQIPTILQQYNTTTFRIILESANPQSEFGILSNMDGVGPTLILELKPTIQSNSTWMYTITGAAIIIVIIGVSIALYFQNKNKQSQKIENLPLLNNKV